MSKASARGFVSVLVLLFIATTHAAAQGMTWDYVSSTKFLPARAGGPEAALIMHGSVNAKGNYRMDIVQSSDSNALYKTGDYLLSADGHKYIVHPIARTYEEVSSYAVESKAAASRRAQPILPNGTPVPVTAAGSSEHTDTISTAEDYDGRPALHMRITSNHAMNVMAHQMISSIVHDYWFAKLPINIAPADANAGGMTAGATELSVASVQNIGSLQTSNGTVVKSTTTTLIDMSDFGAMGPGGPPTVRVTREIKNVKEGVADAAAFVLPADFTKVVR